jgi:hypothetical protein
MKMHWPTPSLLTFGIAGMALGGACYLLAARRKRALSTLVAVEALLQGALFAGALHLAYCVYDPVQMIEVHDKNEQIVHLELYIVKLDNLHAIEILICAAILTVVGLRAFYSIWQKPGH